MDDRAPLRMSFELSTIDHLGIKMYSHIPNAIVELVANSYDSDAKEVYIKINNIDPDPKNHAIKVIDDGVGMSFDDINEKFLRIGRNRRLNENDRQSPSGRKVTGKKGLGKLALFGIGRSIEIKTTQKGSSETIRFILNWDDLKKTEAGRDYEPFYETKTDCDSSKHGTQITLSGLRSKNFSDDPKELAINLSRLFTHFGDDFKCFVVLNDREPIAVNNLLKFEAIKEDEQFSWLFPDFLKDKNFGLKYIDKIKGEIFSTKKPLKKIVSGVTLFANGRHCQWVRVFWNR